MKSKQSNPKSVRPSPKINKTTSLNSCRKRCSLCDSLLKGSSSYRYILMGTSIHDKLDGCMTYAECCEKYLDVAYESDKFGILCPKCCHNLQRVNNLSKDFEDLIKRVAHTYAKTKRLKRTRNQVNSISITRENSATYSCPVTTTDDGAEVTVKEELDIDPIPTVVNMTIAQKQISMSHSTDSKTSSSLTKDSNDYHQSYLSKLYENAIIPNIELKNSHSERKSVHKRQSYATQGTSDYSSTVKTSHKMRSNAGHLSIIQSNSKNSNGTKHDADMQDLSSSPISQAVTESSPSSITSIDFCRRSKRNLKVQKIGGTTSEQVSPPDNTDTMINIEHSLSPYANEEENSSNIDSKGARLSRRQYDFYTKLPDQPSLNDFIENSSVESGSRWTWRRTSANSRGYKVYYVCNFSMRRHYHPCPAAMYALFHPEGDISIYSCGEHQHIPKDRIPVSITDETKEEIFKCLKSGMSTSDIRGRLTQLHLPFGDTRKLNNFIKYHKELLRFGTVTNVRMGGTAYRQPQCWAIRRQQSLKTTS